MNGGEYAFSGHNLLSAGKTVEPAVCFSLTCGFLTIEFNQHWVGFYSFIYSFKIWCCSIAKLYPTLQPQGLQHARLPCPFLSSGVCSNSCLLSQWCRPTISSSVIPFSSCLQSFPALGSFPMSQFFVSSGQCNGSFIFSNSPSNDYTGLISFGMDWLDLLAVQGTLKSLFQHHSSKASILLCLAFFIVQLSHLYRTTGNQGISFYHTE